MWKNLFNLTDIVFWLDYLCSKTKTHSVVLDYKKGNFLVSIYTESMNMSSEAKTHNSLLLRELIREDNFGSVTTILLECHLVEIVLPLFPNYAISHFIGYLAYQSFGTCKYLIENDFVDMLIRCLYDENEELCYFIECAGYIGNYRDFENEMESMIDLLSHFVINDYDFYIKTKAIKSISKIIFNSKKLCSKLVSNNQNFQKILILCGETNKFVSDAVLEMIGAVLNNKIIKDENILFTILRIFDIKLKTSDECTMIYVVEAIERGLSFKYNLVDKTDFPKLCITSGIFNLLIELFSKNIFSFELHSKLFSSICLIFIDVDTEQKINFIKSGFLNFFIDNCFEMIEIKENIISKFLLDLFNLFIQIKDENLHAFFLNEETQNIIELLLLTEDCEVRLIAKTLDEKINELAMNN